MKRDFTLQEINLGKFRNNWNKMKLQPTYNFSSKGSKTPRYFEMTKPLCYESAAKILGGINDKLQVARCLWVPGSIFTKDRAMSLTLRRDPEYLRFLPQMAEESGELFIQTARKLKQNHKNNRYKLKRDNGFWYFAAISISHKDFGSYNCFRKIYPRLSGNKTASIEAVLALN